MTSTNPRQSSIFLSDEARYPLRVWVRSRSGLESTMMDLAQEVSALTIAPPGIPYSQLLSFMYFYYNIMIADFQLIKGRQLFTANCPL